VSHKKIKHHIIGQVLGTPLL